MKKLFAILFSMTAFFALSMQTAFAASSTQTDDTDTGITVTNISRTSHIASTGGVNYTAKSGYAVMPYSRQGKTITVNNGISIIQRGMFDDEFDAEKIVLPSSVTTIEQGALLNWCVISCATQAQKNFCLENGFAVDGTYSIKNGVLTINKGVKVVPSVIARGNTSITKIVLSDTVKTIDAFAFCDMTNLTEITIPTSVEVIGAAAFLNCKKLTSITFPENVGYIGDKAFSGTKLSAVKIPEETACESDSFDNRVVIQRYETSRSVDYYQESFYGPRFYYKTGWQEGDFSSTWKEFGWRIPTKNLRVGTNTITLTYTSGENVLYVKDIELIADGNVIFTDKAERCAGNNPRSVVYTFNLKSVPGVLNLRGSAKTDGGTDSNGTITAQNVISSILEGIIKTGDYLDYTDEVLDITGNVHTIEKNAFKASTKIRVPVGSYAEQWCKQNGYYLCAALADLSTYTKDASLKIDESAFTRILCYTDTPEDIDKYHFNVTHPLTLDVVNGRLELTSYMLYPCKNVTVKKLSSDGRETVVARYNLIQPLARYVVLKNTDAKATYIVTADDDFYKSLNAIPVDWEVSFTQVRENFYKGFWLILRAPVCREWISLITQQAFAVGSNSFRNYFLTSKNRFYTGNTAVGYESTTTKYLTEAEVRKLYKKMTDYSIMLGALDARVNQEVVGMGALNGSLLGIDEPYVGNQYGDKHISNIIAHEMMHNMGFLHDSNLCGHSLSGAIYQYELMYVLKQLSAQRLLPYDDENTLATKKFWYDDFYFINEAVYPPEDDGAAFRWAENELSTKWAQKSYDLSSLINEGAKYLTVTFQYTNGGYNLAAKNLVLMADGKEVARFPGEFTTTTFGRSFQISCSLPEGLKKLILKGDFRTIGGNASSGSIKVNAKIYTMQGSTLKVNSGVKTLSKGVLWDENDAQRIELPSSVTTIEKGALLNWCTVSCATQAQKNFCYENGYAVEGSYSVKNGVLTINSGVKIVPPAIARGNTSITKIILPDTVTTIDAFAFAGMSSLKEVVIPPSIKTIGACAFDGCKTYAPTSIPETVTYIGPWAFRNTGIKKIKLGKDTVYESEGQVRSFDNIGQVEQEAGVNSSVASFRDVAFASAYDPKEGTQYAMDNTGWKNKDFTTEWKAYYWSFPSTELKKGSNTISFTYTSGSHKLCLKDVEITADGIPVLSAGAEQSAGKSPKSAEYTFTLSSVPKALVIRAHARTDGGNKSNGTITINGKTVSAPEKDIIEDGVLKIGYGQTATQAAQYLQSSKFSSIEFPATLQKIEGATFAKNNKLKKVVIPGTVKMIGGEAFADCRGLEELVIEEGVEVIDYSAFYNCTKLKSVTLPKSIRSIDASSLFMGSTTGRTFRCYAGTDAYKLATQYGYTVEVLGTADVEDNQLTNPLTELVYSDNTVIDPLEGNYSNLKYVGIAKAQTISAGAFQKYPVELIDISSTVKTIGKNAFHSGSKLRMPRGSYAETWAKQNGYYLCGTLANLSTYTKDASLKIDESSFTRILCDGETQDALEKYHFNVTHPLTLDVVNGRLELTSYMLYPCQNVTVKKTGADGKESVVAKYNAVQPLARYVVLKNADTKASYTVTADDSFYRSLNEISVNWEVSFMPYFGKIDGYDFSIDLKASVCREWISLITQTAYIAGSSSFAGYFLTSHNRFYTTNDFLTDKQMRNLFVRILNSKKELGVLSNNSYWPGAAIINAPGMALIEQYFGNQYQDENWFVLGAIKNQRLQSNANWFTFIASLIMTNQDISDGSNLKNLTGHDIIFGDEFGYIARQFKSQKLLPYDDEHILASRLFWY